MLSHSVAYIRNIFPYYAPTIAGQQLIHSGTFEPVQAKLTELASGHWGKTMVKLAGSGSQREKLKVRLARASCAKQQSILWQVDVGYDEETSNVQQLIKGTFPPF